MTTIHETKHQRNTFAGAPGTNRAPTGALACDGTFQFNTCGMLMEDSIFRRLIKIWIALSLLFLALYIAYHITTDPTSFGGEGLIKYVYYFILITHILLSITVIPFVLFSYIRAITGDFVKHKKIAKITVVHAIISMLLK